MQYQDIPRDLVDEILDSAPNFSTVQLCALAARSPANVDDVWASMAFSRIIKGHKSWPTEKFSVSRFMPLNLYEHLNAQLCKFLIIEENAHETALFNGEWLYKKPKKSWNWPAFYRTENAGTEIRISRDSTYSDTHPLYKIPIAPIVHFMAARHFLSKASTATVKISVNEKNVTLQLLNYEMQQRGTSANDYASKLVKILAKVWRNRVRYKHQLRIDVSQLSKMSVQHRSRLSALVARWWYAWAYLYGVYDEDRLYEDLTTEAYRLDNEFSTEYLISMFPLIRFDEWLEAVGWQVDWRFFASMRDHSHKSGLLRAILNALTKFLDQCININSLTERGPLQPLLQQWQGEGPSTSDCVHLLEAIVELDPSLAHVSKRSVLRLLFLVKRDGTATLALWKTLQHMWCEHNWWREIPDLYNEFTATAEIKARAGDVSFLDFWNHDETDDDAWTLARWFAPFDQGLTMATLFVTPHHPDNAQALLQPYALHYVRHVRANSIVTRTLSNYAQSDVLTHNLAFLNVGNFNLWQRNLLIFSSWHTPKTNSLMYCGASRVDHAKFLLHNGGSLSFLLATDPELTNIAFVVARLLRNRPELFSEGTLIRTLDCTELYHYDSTSGKLIAMDTRDFILKAGYPFGY